MPKKEIIVISLGGSIVVPDKVNIKFLREFKKLILKHVKAGKRFIIVTGGGMTARTYQNASRALGNKDIDSLDWIGVKATWLNAEVVRSLFGKLAHPKIIVDPSQKVNFTEKILVGAGWKPGWSTDYDAVLLAKQFKAKKLLNLSNIEYVYDKDPNKFKYAKKIDTICWCCFREIVGDKWIPGKNTPFDPVATKLASKLKLQVAIMKGTNLSNINKCISGKEFKGTLIL